MRKSMGLIIIIAIILIGTGAYFALHKNPDKSPSTNSPTTSSSTTSAGKDGPGIADTNTFPTSINDFAFADREITIKKGMTVTWVNKDSTVHTVTESDGQTGPDSGTLATGKSYSFTFNTVGTFKYHCTIHPSMTGTITVTE